MTAPESGGHLDHMLRQTRAHHVHLSVMADLKANMLLTIAGLIITLSVRYLFDDRMRIAAVVLMAFCTLTIALAIYAVMPKVDLRLRRPGLTDLRADQSNPLFFGDFIHLPYSEYLEAMEEVMSDAYHTYEAQVREVYNLGRFLAAKKYCYLRWAYIAFMVGLLASGIVLGISVLTATGDTPALPAL